MTTTVYINTWLTSFVSVSKMEATLCLSREAQTFSPKTTVCGLSAGSWLPRLFSFVHGRMQVITQLGHGFPFFAEYAR